MYCAILLWIVEEVIIIPMTDPYVRQIYGVTFTINKKPSYVSINLPLTYMDPSWDIVKTSVIYVSISYVSINKNPSYVSINIYLWDIVKTSVITAVAVQELRTALRRACTRGGAIPEPQLQLQ